MSVVVLRFLGCDGSGSVGTGQCDAEFGAVTAGIPELRRLARESGWFMHVVNRKLIDKCPECARAGR